MKMNLRDTLFGFRRNQNANIADTVAAKKEQALASINETDTTPAKPRVYRTIGLTEQRLRARNKESWRTSTKGWSDFFGRFTTVARG